MKYRVHVSRDYTQYGDIEVEADSVMEAEALAYVSLGGGDNALFSWGEKELIDSFIESTEELK